MVGTKTEFPLSSFLPPAGANLGESPESIAQSVLPHLTAGKEHASIIMSDQIPIGELLRHVSADETHNSLRYLQTYRF